MFEHKHILLVLYGILISIMQWNKTLNSWQIPLLIICSVIKFSYTCIVIILLPRPLSYDPQIHSIHYHFVEVYSILFSEIKKNIIRKHACF